MTVKELRAAIANAPDHAVVGWVDPEWGFTVVVGVDIEDVTHEVNLQPDVRLRRNTVNVSHPTVTLRPATDAEVREEFVRLGRIQL